MRIIELTGLPWLLRQAGILSSEEETQAAVLDPRIVSANGTGGSNTLETLGLQQLAASSSHTSVIPDAEPQSVVLDQAFEDKVHQHGKEIFAFVKASQTPMLNIPSGMSKAMMEAAMSDPELRIKQFRFIAAFPTLKTAQEKCALMKEYLGDQNLGKLFAAAKFVSGLSLLGGDRLVAGQMTKSIEGMAETFIVESNINEAVKKLEKQWNDKKIGCVLDPLGEAAVSEKEALGYCEIYKQLIRDLTDKTKNWNSVPQLDGTPDNPIPRAQIAIKLSSLCSIADPVDFEGSVKILKDRLRPLLQLAKKEGAFVWIDMEDRQFKDLTLTVFKEILSEPEFVNWQNAGIAVQGYLKESEKDIDSLIAWAEERMTSVSVRLVKGAYWDYEQAIAEINGWGCPVFENKYETDANYEKLTNKLLDANKHINTCVASHNVRSISNALAYAEKLGLEKEKLEFQFLYGMAGPVQEALVQKGHRVRVYTPYGELLPGMAYLVRRLLENSSQVAFMKDATKTLSDTDIDRLLQSPILLADRGFSSSGSSDSSNGFSNEPMLDFSKAENRDRMRKALQKVRGTFSEKYYPVIGGKKIGTGEWHESRNPSNINEVIGHVAFARTDDVEHAVKTARETYETTWRKTCFSEEGVKQRADILRKAAEIMRSRRFELAAHIVFETGKSWKEADADVVEAIDFHKYYAEQAEKNLMPHLNNSPRGEVNASYYEGLGVVAVIAPWNFPLAILAGETSAAIVSGNTVVMKPAEQASKIAGIYMGILEEAGLPNGVCNYLPGLGETVGDALVKHPGIDGVIFTGSRDVGLSINGETALVRPGQANIKRVITEMGGKNAIIVDTTADQDQAIKGVLASAFGYGGQKCSALSRLILVGDDDQCNRFVERLAQAAGDLMVGPADDPAYSYGPQIDKSAYDRIRGYIEIGKGEGEMVCGGKEIPAEPKGGYFIPPHIFDKVKPNARIAQEEIFGPVLSVIRVKTFDDALKAANGTPYALTGGVYSRTPSHIIRAKKEFRVGNLYINRKITGAGVGKQPFGGAGMSGTGPQAGGPLYLNSLVRAKTHTVNELLDGCVVKASDGAANIY